MEEPFELQRHQIKIDRDLQIDDESGHSIIAYIETYFNVDKKFGTQTAEDDSAWINFYGKYDTETGKLTSFFFVETDSGTEYYDYYPTESEEKLIAEMMQEVSLREHGCSLEEWVHLLLEDDEMKGMTL